MDKLIASSIISLLCLGASASAPRAAPAEPTIHYLSQPDGAKTIADYYAQSSMSSVT